MSPRPDADEILTLDASLVVRCLRDGQPLDDLFAQAFERGLAVLPRDRRAGALTPTTDTSPSRSPRSCSLPTATRRCGITTAQVVTAST
jgi:hypothetical protein